LPLVTSYNIVFILTHHTRIYTAMTITNTPASTPMWRQPQEMESWRASHTNKS